VKRTLSKSRPTPVIAACLALIAATYGLVRLSFGLVLPDAQRELGFDASVGGMIAAGGSAMYVVGALVGFAAAARVPRVMIVAAAATAALGAGGVALAPGVGVFAGATVLGSAGAGLASPAVVAVLRSHPGTRTHPRAQMIANSGTGPGLVAASLLAIALLPDWRTAWWVASAVSALAGAAALIFTRRLRSGRERMPPPPASWFALHRAPLLAALLLGVGSAAVWTFGRVLLVDAGLDDTVSLLAWTALGVGGAAVVATARAISLWSARRAWAVTAAVGAIATLAFAGSAGSVAGAILMSVVFGWAYTSATGALIAWTTDIDSDRAASGTAVLFIMLVIGQGIGAAVLGALAAAGGTAAAFGAGALVCALAALPALRGFRRHG
jgi:predicted MFS family arabinose efflux permease